MAVALAMAVAIIAIIAGIAIIIAGSAKIAMAAVQRCDHRHDTHTPQAMPSRKVDEIYATPRVA